MVNFALNQMVVPKGDAISLLTLASTVGATHVELRNDLGRPLLDGLSPDNIRRISVKQKVQILALAEVKAFNDFSAATLAQARGLIDAAVSVGARGIALIPKVGGVNWSSSQAITNLKTALTQLKPLLQDADLIGFIEPIGFQHSTLRFKSDALDAIAAVNGDHNFQLVHDTFHHHLSGERQIYAPQTGIIHVSGVRETTIAPGDMTDALRGFVGADDVLGNVEQVQTLTAAGCVAPLSFEPFSPEVHAMLDPSAELLNSMQYMQRSFSRAAA